MKIPGKDPQEGAQYNMRDVVRKGVVMILVASRNAEESENTEEDVEGTRTTHERLAIFPPHKAGTVHGLRTFTQLSSFLSNRISEFLGWEDQKPYHEYFSGPMENQCFHNIMIENPVATRMPQARLLDFQDDCISQTPQNRARYRFIWNGLQ